MTTPTTVERNELKKASSSAKPSSNSVHNSCCCPSDEHGTDTSAPLKLFSWYPELDEIKCPYKPKSKEAAEWPFASWLHRILHDDNPYLFSGYRKLPVMSVSRSFWSIFTLHNETVNIWTHAIPIIYWIYACFNTDRTLRGVGAPISDRLAFFAYSFTATCTMVCSTIYHTWRMNSDQAYHWCLSCDLRGIILLLIGGMYATAWLLMKPLLFWQCLYGFLTMSFGIALMLWIPRMVRLRLTNQRTIYFSLYAGIGGLSFFHSLYLIPFSTPIYQSDHFKTRKEAAIAFFSFQFTTYVITGVSLLVRGIKGPERFFPYKFDIFGASHQLFHILIVIGNVYGYWGMLDMYLKGCFNVSL